jgi:hypothetical protein
MKRYIEAVTPLGSASGSKETGKENEVKYSVIKRKLLIAILGRRNERSISLR